MTPFPIAKVANKVKALEELYKTDVIGTNNDLEDIAAKYAKLIPADEIEKHRDMVQFLLKTIDLKKVRAAREIGQGKLADKEFTKVTLAAAYPRNNELSCCYSR